MHGYPELPKSRPGRMLLTILLAMAMGIIAVRNARPAEIIPSVGITRAVDGDNTVRPYGSLGFRTSVFAPFLKTEVGVAYHSESRFDDALKTRSWPITASVWLQPVPAFYAGAGVGWYQISNDFDHDVVPATVEDNTTSEFGVHVGGGLRVPIAPAAALDLNGRYVMMQEQEARLVPEKFDPDFWSMSLGIAFGF